MGTYLSFPCFIEKIPIIRELVELRENVARMQPAPDDKEDLAEQLYGALGQGSWDEYDPDLDWQRFEA